MDPPGGPNGPLQRQDASDDEELPHGDDIYRAYEDLKAFPEETVYNSTSQSLIIPINFEPKPADHRSRPRPVPVRPPPPPPTTGARLLPPPVPPRTRAPLKKQLSCDQANPLRRLNRSTTQVDTYVSNPSRFFWGVFFPASAKTHCSIMIHIRPVFSHQDPFTIKLIDTPQGSTKSLASFCHATSR